MKENVPVKFCRHCGHVVPRDTGVCPYCEQQTLRGGERKECPFCGELIKGKAIKCKHCGEFLDQRERPRGEQVVHIEKAVITPGQQGGDEVAIYRPDGTRVETSELQVIPGGGARRKLPPGENDNPEAKLPARSEPSQIMPAPPPGGTPSHTGPAPAPPVGLPEEAPLIEKECPSCGRPVFERDNFCENCGRDLRHSTAQSDRRVRSENYPGADIALLLAAVGPIGLILPGILSVAIPTTATILGGWSLLRIFLGEGKFTGATKSAGAVALAIFWGVVILAT